MSDVRARRQTLRVDHFRDGAAFRDYFKASYGPTISTYRSLAGDPERTAALDRDLLELAAGMTWAAGRWTGSTCC